MKRLFLLLALLALTISCSTDSSTPSTAPNPNLLKRVDINMNTPQEQRLLFNSNGLLDTIKNSAGVLLQTFSYDSHNNVITHVNYEGTTPYTDTFTYDSTDHIVSVNNDPVTFDASTNKYTIDYAFFNTYEYLDKTEVTVNADLLLVSERQLWFSADGNYSFNGVSSSYVNNNLGGYIDNINGEGFYTYDNHNNPLKTALLPICEAMALTNFRNAHKKWIDGMYCSTNTMTSNDYDAGSPEKDVYSYLFNSNNLPTQQTDEFYYLGVLEGTRISAKYYYQGDVLP